jgi:hypothetical protein
MRHVQCKIQLLDKKLMSNSFDEREVEIDIFNIVKAHYVAIELCEKLEEILNFLILVLYSVNTLVLCILFFEFNIVS